MELLKLDTNQSPYFEHYQQFWSWFARNATMLFDRLKSVNEAEDSFFELLSPRLGELKDRVFFLVGMRDDDTAELIFTADGVIKNIVFVEELVAAAPEVKNWKFTALKPEHLASEINVELSGLKFEEKSICFYPVQHEKYPDEIELVIVLSHFTEEQKSSAYSGAFIFIDHLLGEINAVTLIDSIKIAAQADATAELIPIAKLKPYLVWREKEFVEKYGDYYYDSTEDNYTGFEAQLKSGSKLIATMNTAALSWEYKGSHPWILKIAITYDGTLNEGFPDAASLLLINQFDDLLLEHFPEQDGFINLGRETGEGIREIYFACKGFRIPSLTSQHLIHHFKGKLDIDYQIFKDKYWQTFERYTAY
ncbi:MAG: hypothetical protein BGO31_04830 [Bacteroidetes bacterium 43-16]|nr:MAG: hypothetical protein BGO31_04830 [Bacteroidetes bacterium 43-16]